MPELFPTAANYDSDASISADGLYRWTLTRIWDRSKPLACWCCLNPSTADAKLNDPSVRRMISFTRSWGLGGMVLVNAFALRATDPREMMRAADPVGPENDAVILKATASAARVIVAWGCHGSYRGRDGQVMAMLAGRTVECLGLTAEGHPRHPLFVSARTAPVPFTLTTAPTPEGRAV